MSAQNDGSRPPLSRRLHWWALALILCALIVTTIAEGSLDGTAGGKHAKQAEISLHGLARPSVQRFLRRLERSPHGHRPPASPLSRRPRLPQNVRAKPSLNRRSGHPPRTLPGVRAEARAAPILAFDVGTTDAVSFPFSRPSGLPPAGDPASTAMPSFPLPRPAGLWPSGTASAYADLRTARRTAQASTGGNARLRPPPHGHVLLPGTVIPAVLLTRLVSDLSGLVEARTSQAVYGSIREHTLLIPPGSLLIGRYGETVRPGERRIFVSFGRIEMPNGASIRLPGMEAAGRRGGSGLHDLVRTHFWRMFGSSFLIAGLGAALPGNTNRILVLPSGAPLVAGTAAGEALDQTAQALLARDQDLPPTIIIRRGTRFNVLVARTIRFPPAETAPGSGHRDRWW